MAVMIQNETDITSAWVASSPGIRADIVGRILSFVDIFYPSTYSSRRTCLQNMTELLINQTNANPEMTKYLHVGRSGSVGIGRDRSRSVEIGRDRSGSVGIGRYRSGSVGIDRDRSGSVGIGRDRSGSVEIGRDRSGSNRDRSGLVGIGRDRSGSVLDRSGSVRIE